MYTYVQYFIPNIHPLLCLKMTSHPFTNAIILYYRHLVHCRSLIAITIGLTKILVLCEEVYHDCSHND